MSQTWNGPSNWVLVVADESVYLPQAPIQLLWEAGARVVLMAPSGQPMRWSRYVSRWEPLAIDTATAAAQVAQFHARHRDELKLVVHCREDVAQRLAAQSGYAPELTCLPPESAAGCSSKTQFRRWAQGRIDLAQGGVFRDVATAQAWVHHHGKSVLKINNSAGGTGVRVVQTSDDVVNAWESLERPAEFVVEEFLSGLAGVTELVLDQGRVLASFSSLKAVTTGGPLGPSCARQVVHPRRMALLVQQVAEATRYHGMCGFDWIWDQQTDSVRLIEFHPRTPSGFRVGAYAGVDVVAALRTLIGTCDPASLTAQQGRPIRHLLPLTTADSVRAADVCCYFPLHLVHSLRARDWRQVARWLPGSGAITWANVPWEDPGQLIALSVRAAKSLSRSLRQPAQPADASKRPAEVASSAGQSRAA